LRSVHGKIIGVLFSYSPVLETEVPVDQDNLYTLTNKKGMMPAKLNQLCTFRLAGPPA
jgi:hypothetical protein